ncbi:MAG TPA: sodium:solute symporter family protein [Bryobacteraceae bacterium]|nr:sodium:solute symporter family protein [Bryobacteraceae bacterium]
MTLLFLPSFWLQATQSRLLTMSPVDLVIVVAYFVLVLVIGFYLKRYASTGEDFFLAGRQMTASVAGLSFISANLGSLETMGYAAATYQHGMVIAHAYFIAAIPAILFLAIVMMPFYYISKTHSVPGYLKLRYGESTRSISSITFAVMTILMSGINMFSMAKVMQVILGWDFNYSMWVSSLTVAVYVMMGGLLSAIFNEVLQFFLIWFGSLLIPILGLIEAGGWDNMVARINQRFAGQDYTHLWRNMGSFTDNPMGLDWIGVVLGWGIAISFGYWTTDFLVVQRVLAAKNLRSAQLGTILGAALKMCVPLIVILPGLLGLAVLPMNLVSEPEALRTGQHSYNEVLPLMMARYCGPGLLGLGVTALIAGFMSGMAGNVSAFATVWTYDIYKALIRKTASDEHYVKMGRWCSILGVFASIGTAYLVMFFDNIIAYAQVIFIFGIVPQFGTIILGMLWKRVTPKGGFYGLLAGTLTSIGLFAWVRLDRSALKYVAFYENASEMADNIYRAFWCLLATFVVTIVVSLLTKPKPDSELENLVYGLTPIPKEKGLPWIQRPAFWAAVVGAAFVMVNIIFW